MSAAWALLQHSLTISNPGSYSSFRVGTKCPAPFSKPLSQLATCECFAVLYELQLRAVGTFQCYFKEKEWEEDIQVVQSEAVLMVLNSYLCFLLLHPWKTRMCGWKKQLLNGNAFVQAHDSFLLKCGCNVILAVVELLGASGLAIVNPHGIKDFWPEVNAITTRLQWK